LTTNHSDRVRLKTTGIIIGHIQESGPGGIRTLVQTRNKFAFYMLIST